MGICRSAQEESELRFNNSSMPQLPYLLNGLVSWLEWCTISVCVWWASIDTVTSSVFCPEESWLTTRWHSGSYEWSTVFLLVQCHFKSASQQNTSVGCVHTLLFLLLRSRWKDCPHTYFKINMKFTFEITCTQRRMGCLVKALSQLLPFVSMHLCFLAFW